MSVLVRTEGRETGPPPAGLSTASGVAAVTVLTSLPVFLPGAANGLICAELGWSPVRMGAVLAVYWLASLSGAFVSRRAALPPLVERTLSIALFATCLGLFAAAVTPAAGLWISSAVGGYAYGYTQPHTNALLMRRCAPRLRAFAFGLKQAAVPTATLLASVAMPMLAGPVGWRLVFAGTAVLCGVGGVFSYDRVTWASGTQHRAGSPHSAWSPSSWPSPARASSVRWWGTAWAASWCSR